MAAETVSARTPWFWIWRMLALSCALSVSFVRVSARPPEVVSAPNAAFLAEDEAPPFYMLTYDDGDSTAITLDIQAGESVLVMDVNVDTAVNLTADTAAVECNVFIAGT